MNSSLKYATAGTGVVTLAILLLWPFLDPISRRGLVLAALVALPVQIVSYALLHRYRGEVRRFLAAWVGGTLLRMVVIGFAAWLVLRTSTELAVPMLLALASFFFGLLLLEPFYFRADQREAS